MFEEEREYVFGEAKVVEEMKAFSVDAPTDQLVRRLVVHQRPQLGHEGRDVSPTRLIVSFNRGRGRHYGGVVNKQSF